jgi:preprotein translocase subunit SecG
MSQEDIDKAITAQRGSDQYSAGNMFMGLALFYILFFIIALIVALIVRKKKPATADGGDL